MFVSVNGVRLFFDVVGAGLVPDGPRMRQRPTIVFVHGGPGADHSLYRPLMDALADTAQLVYYDQRGNGRSEAGPRERWTLAQWADDLRDFCDALGICEPVVYGASFGGIVALAYATRHPQHPGRLVLVSTTAQGAAYADRRVALFRQLGGAQAGELAERRLLRGDSSSEVLDAWIRVCFPLYTRQPLDPLAVARMQRNADCTHWFSRADGEGTRFDLRDQLQRIACPVLLLGGELDPMVPIENQRDIAALVRPELLQFHEFASVGHGVVADAPDEALALVRQFVRQFVHPLAAGQPATA